MNERRSQNDDALLALLYDELPPGEADALRARLADDDPEGLERLAQWRSIRNLTAGLTAPDPDPQMHYDLIREARKAVAVEEKPSWLWSWIQQITMAPALAALLLVVLAAGLTARLTRDMESTNDDALEGVATETAKAPLAKTAAPKPEAPVKAPTQRKGDVLAGAEEAPAGEKAAAVAQNAREVKETEFQAGPGAADVPYGADDPADQPPPEPAVGNQDKRGEGAEFKDVGATKGDAADSKIDLALKDKAVSKKPRPKAAERKKRSKSGGKKAKTKAEVARKFAAPPPPARPAPADSAPTDSAPAEPAPTRPAPAPAYEDQAEAAGGKTADGLDFAYGTNAGGLADGEAVAPAADDDLDGAGSLGGSAEGSVVAVGDERAEVATSAAAPPPPVAAAQAPAREPAPRAVEAAPAAPQGVIEVDAVGADLDVPAEAEEERRQPQTRGARRANASDGAPSGGDTETDRLGRARALRASGDYRRAVGEYEAYLRDNRGQGGLDTVWWETARSYEQIGDTERALSLYRLVASGGGAFAAQARARIAALTPAPAQQAAPAKAAPASSKSYDFDEAAVEKE